MNKCIFLDRDGVLNVERGDYTYLPEDFIIEDGVPEAVKMIKEAGFLAIVITNQAGITKGIYNRDQMQVCHDILMEKTDFLIDEIYYSPYHPVFSESLTRKPDTLMVEKAIAKYDIDPTKSWLIGDRPRDIKCGQRMGLQTVWVSDGKSEGCQPTFIAGSLLKSVERILAKS